jgi:hypothetical protein
VISAHGLMIRPRHPQHDGGSQGAGPIVCREGALLPEARVLRARASVAARNPVEKSPSGAETRVLSVRESYAADEIEQPGLNVLIDRIDRYSQLHGRPLWLLTGESLGASRRLARTHIVERFLRKRGFSVLDSWSSFRWRCSTTRVSFLERFSEV